MGSDKTIRKIAGALGVSLPRPQPVPNLLPETLPDLLAYTGPAPDVSGAIVGRLFPVKDEGLVEAKLAAGEQAILTNVRAIRAAVAQRMQTLARDAALDTLVAARLAAGGAPRAVEPDIEMAYLIRQRQEYVARLRTNLLDLQRQTPSFPAGATLQTHLDQIANVKAGIDLWTKAPITRPAPLPPPPPPVEPGVAARLVDLSRAIQQNRAKWEADRLAALRPLGGDINARNVVLQQFAQIEAAHITPLEAEQKTLDDGIRAGQYRMGSTEAAPYEAFRPKGA